MAVVLQSGPNVLEAVQAAAVLGNLDRSSPFLNTAVSALQQASQSMDPYVQRTAKAALDRLTAAGAEEIPLDEAVAARTLVVLTPTTADLGLEALQALRGGAGERVRLAAVVRDEEQAREILEGLVRLGWNEKNSLVVALNGEGLEWGIQQAELQAGSRFAAGLNPVVIYRPGDLLSLGTLLVPEKSRKSWQERLDRLGLSTQL